MIDRHQDNFTIPPAAKICPASTRLQPGF